jgi:hypothetical protein
MKIRLTFIDNEYSGLAVLAAKILRYQMLHMCIDISCSLRKDNAVVANIIIDQDYWGEDAESRNNLKNFVQDTIQDIKDDYKLIKDNFVDKFTFDKNLLNDDGKHIITLINKVFEFEHIVLLLQRNADCKIYLDLCSTSVISDVADTNADTNNDNDNVIMDEEVHLPKSGS